MLSMGYRPWSVGTVSRNLPFCSRFIIPVICLPSRLIAHEVRSDGNFEPQPIGSHLLPVLEICCSLIPPIGFIASVIAIPVAIATTEHAGQRIFYIVGNTAKHRCANLVETGQRKLKPTAACVANP